MSDKEDRGQSPIEVVSDDDWKDRVKAEDARLDAEAGSAVAESADESARGASRKNSGPDNQRFPPPSLSAIIQMFSAQALLAMGLMPAPSGESMKELPLARHFIDLISLLEEKTKGNLTDAETALLEQTLHELRMAYLEISRQS